MPTIKDWGKGLNRDQPPWELAPGFWSDCQNMRFRDGLAERCGGIAQVVVPTVTPYWMTVYPSGATRYVIFAGTAKVYSYDGTTQTEITRSITAVSTISSISRTSNVTTVTTGSAHGLTTGDTIQVYGGTGGDAVFNTASTTITVTGATTFTYANVGSNDTGTGLSYTVLLSASALDFTGAQDNKWTGGNFNGVIVANNPVDGLFYWDQAGTGRLRAFAATTYKSDVARVFKYYIVQLAKTVSSVKYRHNIAWSNSAEPGSIPTEFVSTSTNDAGEVDLVSDGEMVDCLEWGDNLIVYKRDVRFTMHYIGGNAVFDFDRTSVYSKDDGLLAADCVVNTPAGQVFLTSNKDIRIHKGGESQSIAEGRVRDWLVANMSTTYYARSFLCVNPTKNEVWICFPATGQSAVTKALLWNWTDNAFGERDLSGVTFACSGLLPTTISADSRMILATNAPKVGLVDSGTTDFGAAYTSMLERTGMDFDNPSWKTLHASMPLFNASTNFTASIYHGSSPTQDGTVTYATAQTYTHNTTKRITAFAYSGPYVAWKMTTTASDTPTLRSIRFDINIDGSD